jgi:plastocyanin
MMRCVKTLLTLSLGLLLVAGRASADGTIKGQVILDEKPPPKKKIEVTQDKAHCLSKGDLFSDKLVVDAETRGVKYVMVWLVDAGDPLKPIGNPALLKKMAAEKLVMDQPCCMFEPHVMFVLPGQTVTFKNSAPISHNTNIVSPGKGPTLNPSLPAGKSIDVTGWEVPKDLPTPSTVSCGIHAWMKAYIRTVPSPYFAVSDEKGNFEIKNAPAGDFKLIIWHEELGWVKGGKTGVSVTVKNGLTTDLGKIKGSLSD